MSKGEQTRQAILEVAMQQAQELGLEGLTLGKLAELAGMSKSGVFAHFRSREDLQLAVLDLAGRRFVEQVLQPALAQPRGLARLRAIAGKWMDLSCQGKRACIFISGSSEYDDRPGPLRDAVADGHRRWRSDLARCVRHAIERGQLRPDTDPEQVAFEIFSLVVGLHHDARLFQDGEARTRAERALDNLLHQYSLQEVG